MPRIYNSEYEAIEDKVARAKFFHPTSNWTWYVIEFDGKDLCWGLASGHEVEFGYFSLTELERTIGPLGLGVERDILFRPTKVKDLAVFSKEGLVY